MDTTAENRRFDLGALKLDNFAVQQKKKVVEASFFFLLLFRGVLG